MRSDDDRIAADRNMIPEPIPLSRILSSQLANLAPIVRTAVITLEDVGRSRIDSAIVVED